MPGSKCPSCGSDRLEIKSIIHTINGGNNTAMIDVNVEICQFCGEILFTPDQVKLFEEVKKKLENGQTEDFLQVGRNFKVTI